MNTPRSLVLTVLVLTASTAALAAGPRRGVAVPAPTTLGTQAMAFAIEEERVAQDLYQLASEHWGLAVFANIRRSETQHVAALAQLAARFRLPVPAASRGVYQTADLQALYTQLAALVAASPESALSVGALVEETDIVDLREAMATVTDPTTLGVLRRLETASWNHLAAFVRNLALLGINYEPQVLDLEEYAARID